MPPEEEEEEEEEGGEEEGKKGGDGEVGRHESTTIEVATVDVVKLRILPTYLPCAPDVVNCQYAPGCISLPVLRPGCS